MAFLSLSLCVSLFFSLATVYIPTSGEEKTEQRGRKNEEICFDNGDALVMQMKLRRCRNFYVFFHAGQSKFFGSLSNRARSCTSAKSSTVEGWFYLSFFFFHPPNSSIDGVPRVPRFRERYSNHQKTITPGTKGNFGQTLYTFKRGIPLEFIRRPV